MSRGAMESWRVLPASAIDGAGVVSDALRAAGCRTFRAAAALVRALPYGRNSDRADFRLVLREGRGTCSTKHALLAAAAREQGLPVALAVGIYDMSEANTPGIGGVLAAHGLRALPEAHCYLVHDACRVDVTRADAAGAEPIAQIHEEWLIEPEQIGEHKIALHREYLRGWLGRAGAAGLDLDGLWSVREACIEALGSGGVGVGA